MKILLTNDDGYFADGLKAFAATLQNHHDVYVVAPHEECSNCAHQVTAGRGLIVQQLEQRLWTVNGWPADCVRVALKHLRLDIDLVVSGINHGGNLGVDIVMSGTCAAAREAAIHGLRAIAFSQVRKAGVSIDWNTTATRAITHFEMLKGRTLHAPGFWNVNLPAINPNDVMLEPVECKADRSPLIMQYEHQHSEGLLFRSDYHNRPREKDRDVEWCFKGHPTISFVEL